ncbi:SAM-dependent methyltransferase [Kitasatospora sp. GAS204A]|uniref:class I SAM-dependent methyltransferase n=1 Tax=unclassified Kitasatospora TaxID=2633591 RepID=UPI00247679BA|nr:class I SAM-dependent methyltransferase [Kitasatospora sp. GAS204B]MDH6119216.1 SAM-dependent methyltransferase [Kitasatospora sp. GAS204B]
MMNSEFYSKVAEKFGGYSSGAQRTVVYADGDPEEVFDQIVHGLGDPAGHLLDVGCADGRNLLAIAPAFGRVHAIDLAPEMLESAGRHLAESGLGQVSFELRDASATGFADRTFDVVTSRRGPLFGPEFQRVLKPGGSLVYLGIGEHDVRELKEVFGRGQLYGRWAGTPVAHEERRRLAEAGFTILREQSFHYDEYFHSPAELNRFLQLVPIFEDYDPVGDQQHFDRYVAQASAPQGVRLARHWFLLHAAKRVRQ